jgi:hypothetical protein
MQVRKLVGHRPLIIVSAALVLASSLGGCTKQSRYRGSQSGNLNSTVAGDGMGGLIMPPATSTTAGNTSVLRGPISWVTLSE